MAERRLAEMETGKLPLKRAETVTVSDLGQIVLDSYRLESNSSTRRAEQALAHVYERFGPTARAVDITLDRLTSYAAVRQEEGAKLATVAYELAILRRAFNLAVRAQRIPSRPPFPRIKPDNRREGFFSEREIQALLAHLPADLRPLVEFLCWTGWRTGEALSLEWRHVDLDAQVIRIERSKNREPRTFPYGNLPAFVALMDRQRERTTAIEQAKETIVSHVFHRDGKPVRSFRRAWEAACVDTGLGHEQREPDVIDADGTVHQGRLVRRMVTRTPHDLRRTAAMRLSRAGVPEAVIMKLCGWKTRSVFDRYRIVPEQDLADGLAKLAGHTESGAERKVVAMKGHRR